MSCHLHEKIFEHLRRNLGNYLETFLRNENDSKHFEENLRNFEINREPTCKNLLRKYRVIFGEILRKC